MDSTACRLVGTVRPDPTRFAHDAPWTGQDSGRPVLASRRRDRTARAYRTEAEVFPSMGHD